MEGGGGGGKVMVRQNERKRREGKYRAVLCGRSMKGENWVTITRQFTYKHTLVSLLKKRKIIRKHPCIIPPPDLISFSSISVFAPPLLLAVHGTHPPPLGMG